MPRRNRSAKDCALRGSRRQAELSAPRKTSSEDLTGVTKEEVTEGEEQNLPLSRSGRLGDDDGVSVIWNLQVHNREKHSTKMSEQTTRIMGENSKKKFWEEQFSTDVHLKCQAQWGRDHDMGFKSQTSLL